MGKDSAIEWTDHTFNPWWGCKKFRPSGGCMNCYAETWATRFGFSVWGDGPRRFFGERHWNDPRRWNRRAEGNRQKALVFCGSMCDIFEGRDDLNPARLKLWHLIEETPNLIWLLLTKRPADIGLMLPLRWAWTKGRLPPNVWFGISASNQKELDYTWFTLTALDIWDEKRRPLRAFLSLEPLLEQIDLSAALLSIETGHQARWILAGGESGHDARIMPKHVLKDVRRQARQANVPFLFKQWGEFVPDDPAHQPLGGIPAEVLARARKYICDGDTYRRVGKRWAGNWLDGQQYLEFPAEFGRNIKPS